MSWNAYLVDDRGHTDGEWNYTHNCNGMANDALDEAGHERPWGEGRHESWWLILDGLSGAEGAALLDTVIRQLQADPERYRDMNPENHWGDYDSFVAILTDMRNSVPEWPTTWSVHG